MLLLETTKYLAEAFKFRGLDRHAGKHSVKEIAHGDRRVRLVFDTTLSREILTSSAFASYNFFEPGMARTIAAGEHLDFIEAFYNSTLLFKEGAEHRELKPTLQRILPPLCEELHAAKPKILHYFRKRKRRFTSAIDFSNALVRLCAGLLIARLTATPLKRVLRALALRRNVFFYFYHPTRHRVIDDALSHLYGSSSPIQPGTAGWAEHLLAQNLFVMGIDPLVASICACITEGRGEPFTTAAGRYAPTSFVLRKCTHPTTISGTEYRPGDVCYLAILPAVNEETETRAGNPASLAFGAGIHACIGKRLSLVILEIAEAVYRDVYSQGFAEPTEIATDGAFLAFRKA